MALNTLLLLATVLSIAKGSTSVDCLDSRKCIDNTIREFFDKQMPQLAKGLLSSTSIKEYFYEKWNNIWKVSDDSSESRQYYDTGYDSYPASGYQYYGGYPSSNVNTPSPFNGLDVALSALAFLSFGVWLFNLILPQLTGSNLPSLGNVNKRSLSNNLIEEIRQNDNTYFGPQMTQMEKNTLVDNILMFGAEELLNNLETLIIKRKNPSKSVPKLFIKSKNWMLNFISQTLGLQERPEDDQPQTSLKHPYPDNAKTEDTNIGQKIPRTTPSPQLHEAYTSQTRESILDYAVGYLRTFLLFMLNPDPAVEGSHANFLYKFPKSRSRRLSSTEK